LWSAYLAGLPTTREEGEWATLMGDHLSSPRETVPEPLYTYRPVPYNELGVAVFLMLLLGTFVFAPLAAPAGLFPLGGYCFVPLLAVAASLLLTRATPTVITAEGIEVSRPWVVRLLRGPRFVPFSAVKNIYPASYEVTGAFMSPFASSAGTLVHVGLGIETNAGEKLVARFTPGTLRGFRAESPGYAAAIEWVRRLLRERGRALVLESPSYSDHEVARMTAEAREPLLPLEAIVIAFFLPPSVIAALLALAPGSVFVPAILAGIVLVAAVPPVWAVYLTWKRSRRRNDLLTELAKHREFLRERGDRLDTV